MDLATIGARYLRSKGLLDDLEVSEENNACSVFVDVDVDDRTEKWLLQFKNETHNHPTEIEPFGGASTCLAVPSAIRCRSQLRLSGDAVLTGAGNIYQPVSETLPGKLPQRVISLKAAAGYSSYGNQIGLATTHVREVYHPDYVAKRLEVGAVVGAVKAENVRRESPVPGDVVLLLGAARAATVSAVRRVRRKSIPTSRSKCAAVRCRRATPPKSASWSGCSAVRK